MAKCSLCLVPKDLNAGLIIAMEKTYFMVAVASGRDEARFAHIVNRRSQSGNNCNWVKGHDVSTFSASWGALKKL